MRAHKKLYTGKGRKPKNVTAESPKAKGTSTKGTAKESSVEG